jgi:hypothetical protein
MKSIEHFRKNYPELAEMPDEQVFALIERLKLLASLAIDSYADSRGSNFPLGDLGQSYE